MTKLIFLYKNFKLNIFQNLFMILQICFLFVFINATVADLIYNNNVNNYIPNYKDNKYFLSGATAQNVGFADFNGFHELVAEVEAIGGVDSVGYQIEESFNINDRLVLGFYINDGMSDIKYPLAAGEWFHSGNMSDGVILGGRIAKDYHVGDQIEIEHLTYLNGVLAYVPHRVTVIGKLKSPAYIVNLNYTSTNPNAVNLLQPYDDVVLTRSERLLSSEEEHYPLGSFMVNLENDKVPSALLNYGQCHSLVDVQENSIALWEKTLQERIPATLTLFTAILFGLIGTIYLFVYKSMKCLSIFYLCGLKKGSMQKMIFLLHFLCIIIGFFVSVLILTIPAVKELVLGYANLGVANLIASIWIIVISSLLSFVFSNALLRDNPLSILRRFE